MIHPSSLPNFSKSCEDFLPDQVINEQEAVSNHTGQLEGNQKMTNGLPSGYANNKLKSGRKFTFQSTIRQIERKKIAEKLSKEAEEKGTILLAISFDEIVSHS